MQFKDFLNQLKTTEHSNLIEAIEIGYHEIFESTLSKFALPLMISAGVGMANPKIERKIEELGSDKLDKALASVNAYAKEIGNDGTTTLSDGIAGLKRISNSETNYEDLQELIDKYGSNIINSKGNTDLKGSDNIVLISEMHNDQESAIAEYKKLSESHITDYPQLAEYATKELKVGNKSYWIAFSANSKPKVLFKNLMARYSK